MLKYDEKKTYDLIPEGDYEVVATEYTTGVNQFGDPFTNFKFVIRTDVEQPMKGRTMFYRMSHNERTESMWAKMCKALGVPNGTEFADYEDWAIWVLGKPVKAVVKHKETEKGTFANISYFKNSEASEPDMNSVSKGGQTTAPLEIDDDQMPF